MLHGHRVATKGADLKAVQQIVQDLRGMCIKRAAYRTDREPSITGLLAAVNVKWEGELVPEEAAKG